MREEHIDQFEAYLNGKMAESESFQFEKKLEDDANFREEFEEFKAFKDALRINMLQEKYELLKKFEAEKENRSAARIFSLNYRQLAIAVMVISIIFFSVVLYMQSDIFLNERKMYVSNNFEQLMVHESFRSANEQPSKEAYNEFVLEDFDQAIPKLNELWKENRDTAALYYLLLSYIMTEKTQQADSILHHPALDKYPKIDTLRELPSQ